MISTKSGFQLGQLIGLPRICVRHHSNQKPRKPTTGFQGPEGHGEKIWVWCHRRQEQIVYSFKPSLDNAEALKQLPFNGKKTKPAKIRKDYWSPLAIIEFPRGQGSVGRSVFQKLRELKHLHEVNWGDEALFKHEDELSERQRKAVQAAATADRKIPRFARTVQERGFALNRQKKNAVADMAAVLAGLGRGNLVKKGVAAGKGDSGKPDVEGTAAAEGAKNELVRVKVKWANDQDKNYAQEWSSNVKHALVQEPSYIAEPRPGQPTPADVAAARAHELEEKRKEKKEEERAKKAARDQAEEAVEAAQAA